MRVYGVDRIHPPRRDVSLDTLVRLRWLAVVGQTAAVLFVYFWLGFALPLVPCLSVIALAAWVNVALRVRFAGTHRLEPERTAWLLAFDTAQLTMLLYFTGGQENPFSFLLLGPLLLGATVLPARLTLILGAFAVFCITVIVFYHYPLPQSPATPIDLPAIYVFGNWVSILVAMSFIGIYVWQVSEDSRKFANALATTELVLAREQHLTQLDGLAAAAAHALGTPLSTISVIAKELEREIDSASPHVEDVRLLREQAQRCRDILSKLTVLSGADTSFDRLALPALIEEVVAPHRNFGVSIEVSGGSQGNEPIGARNPGIIYGLGNLVENAVDFAAVRVQVGMSWDEHSIAITISDDGPGFAPEVIGRIGEPYVRSRRRRRMYGGETTGLGLGVFIAKTLLERSGAVLTFANRAPPLNGAAVTVKWERAAFERMPAMHALENTGALG
jgi:two-component system sensor histidine kinase RegB